VIKLIGVWSEPNDAAGFEQHYREVHMPLAAAVPGVADLVMTRTDRGLGGDPSFYRSIEVHFATHADFDRATSSDEWGAVLTDAGEMIERFGVTLAAGVGDAEAYRTDYPVR